MMLNILLTIVLSALRLYDLLLLIRVIVQLMHVTPNQWIVLLESVTEPVLAPIRGFLNAKLPAKYMIFDWSPLVVWIASGLVQRLLTLLYV